MRKLHAIALSLVFVSSASIATDESRSFIVGENTFGRWNGAIETFIDWKDGEPFLDSAVCELRNGPLSVRFRTGTFSGRRAVPDIDIDERELAELIDVDNIDVTSVTVGTRSFLISRDDWQTNPWFSNYGYKTEQFRAGTGDSFLVYREAESDPKLALGLLLDELMNADRFVINYRGVVNRDGSDEVIFRSHELNNGRLAEGVSWCVSGLISHNIRVLPDGFPAGSFNSLRR